MGVVAETRWHRWTWSEPLASSCVDTSIGQVREIRYRAIADDLRRRVEAGEFAAGRTLPSESELSASYEASRVTIRKALELLRDEGLVDARQGFGWFAAVDPLRQSLGTARHDRGAARRPRACGPSDASSTSASWPPRLGCARCSARRRCSRCDA